ncbi:MAG: heavy metal translocating P-type ATPase [Bulleidia sp.]
MEQYEVTGMTCAACSARVEKAVNRVPGVTSCSVSLLTNSMGVEGNADPSAIIEAVQKAGYGAALKKGRKTVENTDNAAEHEMDAMKKRLVSSMVIWLVLMYVSMGHMMWGWPLPPFFDGNHIAMGLLQMLLTIAIMVINQRFFISGFRSLWHRAPNMDALVAIGSLAAFVYSTCALFLMSDAMVKGDSEMVMYYMEEFYFESAGTILTLITLGKTLEARSRGRTTDALKSLMKLAPKTAVIIKDGMETTVDIEQVQVHDLFAVKPGETIPVDGIVHKGSSAVNESSLTGESIPVDKQEGSRVSAGTINQSGYLVCEAIHVGQDTTLSKIIQMVSDASATKAPIAKVADRVSGVFVPAVMVVALITIVVWLVVGKPLGFALARGISVLVISCPCALGLATPVAIMVGSGMGAKHGILFKTAVSLEETGKADVVILDKTGTITNGTPVVTDLIPVEGVSEKQLLKAACTLEAYSEHPLARAVVTKGRETDMETEEVTDFRVLPGNGLQAVWKDKQLVGGSLSHIRSIITVDQAIQDRCSALSRDGKTPLLFGYEGNLLGIIAVADTIRDDSAQAIEQMQNMGMHVVMLTGDNPTTAEAIGTKAGVDEVIAGVLPDGKEAVVQRFRSTGKVIMVGDGINDAPALTSADIGIAIGAGADVAIDAADVVLMKSELADVPAAIRLSQATLKNIHENLFWAFFYNTIGIPLAAGVFIPFLGWQLNPMFAAAAMSLSSFCVVSNALRLNMFRMYDSSKDHKVHKHKTEKKEKKTMEKTLKIEGMMCGHCEMHTRKALEGIEGVVRAVVSHVDGTAVVTLDRDVSNETLAKAVEEEGYKVTDIR